MPNALDVRWVFAAATSEFGASRQLARPVDEIDILLLRYGTDVLALQNRCSHLGKPLFGSRVMAGQIICAFHGACFDIKTGVAIAGPAVSSVRTYPVQIREGDIFVGLDKMDPTRATLAQVRTDQ